MLNYSVAELRINTNIKKKHESSLEYLLSCFFVCKFNHHYLIIQFFNAIIINV